MTGGTSKVWNGAGDGTVHSRPLAPSHERSAAFFFEKYTQWMITPRKISCEAPNQKPPMELIFLGVVIHAVFFSKKKSPDRSWEGAKGLEWTVPSPAPFHTFAVPPVINDDELAHGHVDH